MVSLEENHSDSAEKETDSRDEEKVLESMDIF